MRRFLIFLLLLATLGCAGRHPIVGRWKTVDKDGNESALHFKEDNTFEALTNGEKLIGKWNLNEEVNPPRLELVFEERIVRTLVKLSGDQLTVEQAEEEAEYPEKFTDKATKYRRQ